MGDIYAYNVMFNLGTGMENVTHQKNMTLARHLNALPRPWEIVAKLAPNSIITSNVNHLLNIMIF